MTRVLLTPSPSHLLTSSPRHHPMVSKVPWLPNFRGKTWVTWGYPIYRFMDQPLNIYVQITCDQPTDQLQSTSRKMVSSRRMAMACYGSRKYVGYPIGTRWKMILSSGKSTIFGGDHPIFLGSLPAGLIDEQPIDERPTSYQTPNRNQQIDLAAPVFDYALSIMQTQMASFWSLVTA